MPKKKPLLYPVVFMIGVTAVFTFLLAFINASTIDEIKRQENLTLQRSILYVFDIAFDENNDNQVTKLYEENIIIETKNDRPAYIYKKDTELIGYAFQANGTGLWGSMTGHIAFGPDFEKILGINFIAHSETPGLGGRIDELWYKDQFRNITFTKGSQAIIYRPADGGNVDAITGATLTSKSVKNMINSFIPEITSYAEEVGYYEGN